MITVSSAKPLEDAAKARTRPSLADVVGFLRFVFARWRDDRAPQVAASLTYTSLLAITPVFAIAVALLSSAGFFREAMVQLKIFLLVNLAPEIAGRIITEYMPQFAHNARRLTTYSLVFLMITATVLMLTIDRSFNAIWKSRGRRPYWLSVLAYLVLLVSGPLLIGLGVTITTYVMTLSAGVGVPEFANPALLRLIPTLFSAIAFFLLYRIVPHGRVHTMHAAVGGLVAAMLFEAAKELFAIYVRYAPTYSAVYGTFAALPLFLLWVYMSWLVVLFGAELTASLEYWNSRLWTQAPRHDPRYGHAVALARHLFEARGAAVPFEHLRAATGMPLDQLEDALHHMTASGMVERVGRDGYAIRETGAPPPPQPRRLRHALRKARREARKWHKGADGRPDTTDVTADDGS